jgi:tetratricopeptide (TPR) repeat protein
MRILFIIQLFFTFLTAAQAQTDSLSLRWWQLETRYATAHRAENHELAAELAQEMLRMCEQHFSENDTVRAYAIYRLGDQYIHLKQYGEARDFLYEHLYWAEEQAKSKQKINSHSQIIFLYANASVLLGQEYMEGISTSELEASALFYKVTLQHFDNGINAYLLVQKLQPKHPDIVPNLAVAYREKGHFLGRHLNDLTNSQIALEQSLKYVKDVDTYRILGIVLGMQNKHLEAIKAFKKSLSIRDNAPAWFNLSVTYAIMSASSKNKSVKERYSEKSAAAKSNAEKLDPDFGSK